MHGTWKVTGGGGLGGGAGGGGFGAVAALIAVVVLVCAAAVKVADAVARAVAPALAELVLIVAIVLSSLVCVAVAGLLALAGVRVWRWHVNNPQHRVMPAPPPLRVMQAHAEPRAVEAPKQAWPAGSRFAAGRERQQQKRP